MHQKPAVQPAVQPRLALKLARFVANVCKIVKGCVRRSGQQSTQSGECAGRFLGVAEALATLSGMFEERPHLLKIEAAERHACVFGEQDNFRGGRDSSTRACADGGPACYFVTA